MRKLFFIIIGWGVFSCIVYAQDEVKKEKSMVIAPEKAAQKMIEKMEQDIVLSEEQKTMLMQKATELMQNWQEIDAGAKARTEEGATAKKTALANYNESLKSILTSEQQEQLETKRKLRWKAVEKELMQILKENEKE